MFTEFPTFDKIVEACDCKTGFDNWKNYFTEHGDFNYWCRLIPVKSDYCLYINVYRKESK